MRKPKLTPWFAGDTQPARAGVYQRLIAGEAFFAYWAGSGWCEFVALRCTPDDALARVGCPSAYTWAPWRGMAAPATQAAEGAK